MNAQNIHWLFKYFLTLFIMYNDVHLLGKCEPFRFNFVIIHKKILYKLGVKFHHIKNEKQKVKVSFRIRYVLI